MQLTSAMSGEQQWHTWDEKHLKSTALPTTHLKANYNICFMEGGAIPKNGITRWLGTDNGCSGHLMCLIKGPVPRNTFSICSIMSWPALLSFSFCHCSLHYLWVRCQFCHSLSPKWRAGMTCCINRGELQGEMRDHVWLYFWPPLNRTSVLLLGSSCTLSMLL